ncbi:hypothetical protein LWI29_034539 [Acer saccharum]|uniref:Uncharacterized protein n=1 Tax=Acer saccharum TaxID=4024 RepID=A0AA39S5E6_ACESA|nr:hypothetical protein LWI29_034539 [Acer saccharum]
MYTKSTFSCPNRVYHYIQTAIARWPYLDKPKNYDFGSATKVEAEAEGLPLYSNSNSQVAIFGQAKNDDFGLATEVQVEASAEAAVATMEVAAAAIAS